MLLRVAFGLATIAQGAACLHRAEPAAPAWFLSVAAIISGALLLIGLLTPIAAVAVALGALAIKVSLVSACEALLFDSSLAMQFGAVILAAIVLLGPGAFSVDARLFGRREIIIPPSLPLP